MSTNYHGSIVHIYLDLLNAYKLYKCMTVKLTIEANHYVEEITFDHLGNPGSFAGTARVCPCLATDLPDTIIT